MDNGFEEGGLGGRARGGADALEPEPIQGVSGDWHGEGDARPIGETFDAGVDF